MIIIPPNIIEILPSVSTILTFPASRVWPLGISLITMVMMMMTVMMMVMVVVIRARRRGEKEDYGDDGDNTAL